MWGGSLEKMKYVLFIAFVKTQNCQLNTSTANLLLQLSLMHFLLCRSTEKGQSMSDLLLLFYKKKSFCFNQYSTFFKYFWDHKDLNISQTHQADDRWHWWTLQYSTHSNQGKIPPPYGPYLTSRHAHSIASLYTHAHNTLIRHCLEYMGTSVGITQ